MNTMNIPAETIDKMNALPSEKMAVIIQIVDQLSMSPVEKFRAIRERSAANPMTDCEIDTFVENIRDERNASRN